MSVLYVEGGGDKNKRLATQCRQGFAKFFAKAGIQRHHEVVVCGGRDEARRRFQRSTELDSRLLIDSEGPAPTIHEPGVFYMIQAMEAWFYADKTALVVYYGQGFNLNALSRRTNVEEIPKVDLLGGTQPSNQELQQARIFKEPGFVQNPSHNRSKPSTQSLNQRRPASERPVLTVDQTSRAPPRSFSHFP